MAEASPPFVMEDVRIIHRNFQGRKTEFNEEGKRNFSVVLPPHVAATLSEWGWNVKVPKARPGDDGDVVGDPFLPVEIGYKIRPPKIVMISSESKKRTHLGQHNVEVLDWVDIVKVDLTVRGRPWENAQGSGIKCWLQTMYITIEEDPLDAKYDESPSQDLDDADEG